MKPLIYVTKSLPRDIFLDLQERFQLSIWEEEDFAMLEQAVEQAELDQRRSASIEA